MQGKRTECLVDTGADRTLISADLLDVWAMTDVTTPQVRPTSTLVKAACGTQLTVRGELPVLFGSDQTGTPFVWNCLVVEGLLHEVILGNDIFDRHGVVINYTTRRLYWDAFNHPLTLFTKDTNTSVVQVATTVSTKLHMSDNLIINPREQVQLLVSAANNQLPLGDYLFERTKQHFNATIHVGHGLVTLRSDRLIPVRLMNTGQAPVRIYKGTLLGELTQLTTACVNMVTLCDEPTYDTGGPVTGRRGNAVCKPARGAATDSNTSGRTDSVQRSKPAHGVATDFDTSGQTGSGQRSKPARGVATGLKSTTPRVVTCDGQPSASLQQHQSTKVRRVYIDAVYTEIAESTDQPAGKADTTTASSQPERPAQAAAETLPTVEELINKMDLSHLTVEQQQRLKGLLLMYGDVLSRGKSDLGKTDLTQHFSPRRHHPRDALYSAVR